jgi:hypothetical protein
MPIRTLHNKLHGLHSSESTVTITKLRWKRYFILDMVEMRNGSNFSVQKLHGKRPKGRPRHKGEDNPEIYI